MCGILAVFGRHPGANWATVAQNREIVVQQARLIRHRGPDDSFVRTYERDGVYLAFERLAIIDPTTCGRQPFEYETNDGKIAWIHNGETYNHEDIRNTEFKGEVLPSRSDCYVTGRLYAHNQRDFAPVSGRLDGMFAIALYDEKTGEFFATRDELGKATLYWGKDETGAIWVGSEMKCIQNMCKELYLFPPGHYMRATRDGKVEFTRWFNPPWVVDPEAVPKTVPDLAVLRKKVVDAVVKRLMTDVPFGILLSGGLDSSLVAAVAVKHLKESHNTFDMGRLKTFSVGLEGSPDLAAARKVADFLGTDHTEVTFTVQEGIDSLKEVIWHLESYEQIRAATPMYLLCRRIRAMGLKMILSGEGADEIFGGYLYFHKAPSPEEFHKECVRKTSRLHQWDVLRANKAPFAWSVEPRTPFLDRDLINYVLDIDPSYKMINPDEKPDGVHPKIEKYLLRKAFDTPEDPYLPEEVLWRQKEQFSDGVGYDWVDGLRAYAQQCVTDEMWAKREEKFPEDTPRSREYYLLRTLFEEQFPSKHALDTVPKGLSVACSTPEAVSWDPSWKDLHEISGRAVGAHASSKGFVAMDGTKVTTLN